MLAPNDTVGMVKSMINCELHIPVSDQRLVYAGLVLEDEHTLSDYSIQRNSTLQLLGCKFMMWICIYPLGLFDL